VEVDPIPVVDVFAGPGGLNEGFSAYGGGSVFSTVASVEMDPIACQTLRLRAAVRRARRVEGQIPNVYFDFMVGDIPFEQLIKHSAFAPHWKHAVGEVHEHELSEASRPDSDKIIEEALGASSAGSEPWVLIGGPPCQAYSLAGRSRRKHDAEFAADHKHTLYREYLHIIERFRPHVFVMENVKGMLSSKHDGGRIFMRILDDLRAACPGYDLRSFVVPHDDPAPTDFIIRAEKYGVPQSRHRVIILGVRNDCAPEKVDTLSESRVVTVRDAIGDLPKIRSGVSPRSHDDLGTWQRAFVQGMRQLRGSSRVTVPSLPLGTAPQRYEPALSGALGEWLRDQAPPLITQHNSRHHMAADLSRYVYLAHRASDGIRDRVNELPAALMPAHRNAARPDAPFADRFRVQVADRPSSTVTSHIAKDGHYYIHYDASQMRSLTVREAARLQTFPDNYHFMGNRTQQYHQVGNAVPPLLATQLAEIVAGILGR
jgi:DNA (cytosine-5)-methyltransferase 1